jgi:hypothetical protein
MEQQKQAAKQAALDIPASIVKPAAINFGSNDGYSLPRIPPADISSYLANVHWAVNYYLYGHESPHRGVRDPLAKHPETGANLHGYVWNEEARLHQYAAHTPLPAVLI